MPSISLIICTYNRAQFLDICLNSLSSQDLSDCEVIVVDNNSTDESQVIISKHIKLNKRFRGVKERNQGLSHARNRAIKEAKGTWIAYLDDDAYASPTFISEIRKEIIRDRFDGFGGIYLPWYKFGKKTWYKDIYGSNENKKLTDGLLDEGHYIDGGNAIFKREMLLKLSGFSLSLGMSGKKISYGEETELQIRAKKNGYRLGFNPEVIIYHLVPMSKQEITWFVKSSFNNGKMFWEIHNFKPNSTLLLKNILRICFSLLQLFSSILFYPFIKKDNQFKNVIIDFLSPLAFNTGKLISGLHQMWRKN